MDFHEEDFLDDAGNYDETKMQRYLEETTARSMAGIKASYPLASLGSKTRMGGEVVTASCGDYFGEYRIARVGDLIRYPDGSESRIVSGAGWALTSEGLPVAIVGSATDNGDTIIESLQSSAVLSECEGYPIPGLLQPGYVPPRPDAGK